MRLTDAEILRIVHHLPARMRPHDAHSRRWPGLRRGVMVEDWPPPRQIPPRSELLFEFVRASDRAPMTCDIVFHGESYEWEAQFFERGELFYAHGGFTERRLAVQWAEEKRKAFEGGQ